MGRFDPYADNGGNNSSVLSITGFHADGQRLYKAIMIHVEEYKQNNKVEPDIHSIAHLLSYLLYSKRFFPYYTFPILSGLDKNGTGVVYSYDPVGSFEMEPHRVSGSSASLIQPFLDSQILGKNSSSGPVVLQIEDAHDLAITAFKSATERDIYTGDTLEIIVLTPGNISKELVSLRRD